ncbi:MAG: preprotein translocase subunit SecE [Actinobacteria bacterium]|nr:preprotein translocase subunit SecE [Actinomycetota bacterium]
MARQTRAQRRARRLAEGESARRPEQGEATRRPDQADGIPAPRASGRAARAPADRPQTEAASARQPGGGSRRFIFESWAELQKVDWPGQRQVMQGTVVVIIACAIVGTYLWSADLVLKRVVQNILLGQ